MRLKIHGKPYETGFSKDWVFESRPGGISIATNAKTLQRIRLHLITDSSSVSVAIQNNSTGLATTLTAVIEKTTIRRVLNSNSLFESDIKSEFPGKIRKILIKEGAYVSSGDTILVLEAMKMEFNMSAPTQAKVKKILVKEGDQVMAQDRLVELEETTEPGKASK